MQTWRLCIPTKWRLCIRIIYANLEALHSNKNGGGYATKMQTLEMILFPRRRRKSFPQNYICKRGGSASDVLQSSKNGRSAFQPRSSGLLILLIGFYTAANSFSCAHLTVYCFSWSGIPADWLLGTLADERHRLAAAGAEQSAAPVHAPCPRTRARSQPARLHVDRSAAWLHEPRAWPRRARRPRRHAIPTGLPPHAAADEAPRTGTERRPSS